jgi:VanZ family protein
MRIFFTILSIAYIAGIFIFADSSVVSALSSFNPYSLLHIPLFGILTFLLIFSFVPMTQLPNYLITRFLVVGFIALVVAIADEIHQAYVPGRDASITDVLLDLVGITLVLFIFLYFYKTKEIRKANPLIP